VISPLLLFRSDSGWGLWIGIYLTIRCFATPDLVGLCLPLVLPLFPFRLHWLTYPLDWASPLLFLVGLVVSLDRYSPPLSNNTTLLAVCHDLKCLFFVWPISAFDWSKSWLLVLKRTVFVLCEAKLFRNMYRYSFVCGERLRHIISISAPNIKYVLCNSIFRPAWVGINVTPDITSLWNSTVRFNLFLAKFKKRFFPFSAKIVFFPFRPTHFSAKKFNILLYVIDMRTRSIVTQYDLSNLLYLLLR